MSQDPPDRAADESRDAPIPHGHPPADDKANEAPQRGRHELPAKQPRPDIGSVRRTGLSALLHGGRSRLVFGTLAALLCLVLGIAIVTQVRQTKSGDSLDTARPADLLVLLDSLRQREATLNTEVSELQNTLNSLQASGNTDQAAIQSAQARLAALSILVGPLLWRVAINESVARSLDIVVDAGTRALGNLPA